VAWGGIEPPTQGFSIYLSLLTYQALMSRSFYKRC
jgi:hypothetical protein